MLKCAPQKFEGNHILLTESLFVGPLSGARQGKQTPRRVNRTLFMNDFRLKNFSLRPYRSLKFAQQQKAN
jgi:hypothetical protein